MPKTAENTSMNDLEGLLDPKTLHDSLQALHIPGAAVAVRAGDQRAECVAGFSNVPNAAQVAGNTLFQVGSITKVFTATLLCRLHEEGLVDLDSPVSDYLPELRIADQAPPITLSIRTLLDYSSGIEGQFFRDCGSDVDALKKYVAACNQLRMIHEPGKMRGYNSTSYCIAGRLIEVVTGKDFDAALASQLLEPLGIGQYSFYDLENLSNETAVGHYWDAEEGRFAIDQILRLPRSMSPAGSSLSLTVAGLLKFADLHRDGGITESGDRYLSERMIREMRTSMRTVPPNNSELMIGWAALPLGDHRLTIASGRTVGQNAFVCFCPEYHLSLAIVANSVMGGEQLFASIGLSVIDKLTGIRPALPAPKSVQESTGNRHLSHRYTGTYANPARVCVTEADGGLAMTADFEEPASGVKVTYTSAMHPVGEHTFALIAEGQDQASGTAQFLFESPESDDASHVFTSGCMFGRVREP